MFKSLQYILSIASVSLIFSDLGFSDSHNKFQWFSWRGPDGNGVSYEKYKNWKFEKNPSWSYELKGRGTPVIADGKMFVEVVTVPRGPLPSTTSHSILNSYAAHRQLSLCNQVPNILGVDDTSSEDEIYYFYSFAPGGITAAELLAIGGPLHESQPLFKFITSQILNAFIALDEQCMLLFYNKIYIYSLFFYNFYIV